jgi:hypothetical protein
MHELLILSEYLNKILSEREIQARYHFQLTFIQNQ